MDGFLVVLIFGFPAVFVSLIVSAIGVWKEKFWLVIIGAVLFTPFSYYLNGLTHNSGWPYLLPLLQMVSAAAVYEKNKLWAWLLLLPTFLISLYILAVGWFVQIR